MRNTFWILCAAAITVAGPGHVLAQDQPQVIEDSMVRKVVWDKECLTADGSSIYFRKCDSSAVNAENSQWNIVKRYVNDKGLAYRSLCVEGEKRCITRREGEIVLEGYDFLDRQLWRITERGPNVKFISYMDDMEGKYICIRREYDPDGPELAREGLCNGSKDAQVFRLDPV
ncbi:hypothetical protein THASP1DRAFT_33305 [Thamnocephalis sphaerospora]|uniref:Uncharacterized protein n=1 Tax=Thamnocephalis sphaerospora TaxID=78915 RepID=A0A4P9XGW2_9FUNG|nr:hypothetical protein THASP1DRAFT_33305 [Thamnocephalis sphaerospora]|eukprot:RKP04883.1 hypothetical protein THASP1DRAFT_33305 [Thamnocephalis sphaerospora]